MNVIFSVIYATLFLTILIGSDWSRDLLKAL